MQSSTANLNGIVVHYWVEGRGPDVVLIHGWGSSRQMWGHLSSALAPAHQCWSLDLPGFGDSERPDQAWYSIPNYTATVLHFMEAMGLARAHLIGHSMGGLIALDFSAAHPERVARLVAMNPVVTGRAYLRAAAAWERSAAMLDNAVRLSRRFVRPVLAHPVSHSLHQGVRHLHRRFSDFSRTTPEVLVTSGRAVTTYDVSSKLADITAPTLIILGTLDANVPNSEGHLAAVEIPNARLAVFTAGHAVTDDHPEAVWHVVREFLA